MCYVLTAFYPNLSKQSLAVCSTTVATTVVDSVVLARIAAASTGSLIEALVPRERVREHSLNEGLLLSAMDELNELEVAHQSWASSRGRHLLLLLPTL